MKKIMNESFEEKNKKLEKTADLTIKSDNTISTVDGKEIVIEGNLKVKGNIIVVDEEGKVLFEVKK